MEKSMNLPSYPRVYNLGHRAIQDLLKGPVVVQEKIDGSQFSFGVLNGELHCRSKKQPQHVEAPDKLFSNAVATVQRLFEKDKLHEGWVYRGEVLMRPRHNVLTYDRVPEGNVILFDIDIGEEDRLAPDKLVNECDFLGLESVPFFYQGEITSFEDLKEHLETTSVLGGTLLEGIVIKNYDRFGIDGKMLMGKWVRGAYKESHQGKAYGRPKGVDLVQEVLNTYRTTQRWEKAIIHLQEQNRLAGEPQDIGPLIKEVYTDVYKECGDEIRELLFKKFWKDISRGLTRGLPEWYKEKLVKEQFDELHEALKK